MNTPAETLARLAIQTLDRQQCYFRGRQTAVLDECKVLESQLRAAAAALPGDDLAGLTLRTLDAQRRFFAGDRSRDTVALCRGLERRLRVAATHVLHPVNVQPSLFEVGA